MEYKIIYKKFAGFFSTNFIHAAEALTVEVNESIRQGWEPQGGVCAGETGGHTPYIFQAMVKRR